LWCIGERGFVLGWKLGLAMGEDPITQALEASSKQKDHLEKVFVNLEAQTRAIIIVTIEWKDFKDYFVDID
jgi:hypothetical protein